MSVKLAIIGATGLVGRTMLKVLQERQVPVDEVILVASTRSRNVRLSYAGKDYPVTTMSDNRWKDAQIALLSAGKGIALQWIPELVKAGIICIDNSSAFRQEQQVPLIVPEVNAHALKNGDMIIANPNCSTIQLVIVLAPLHQQFQLEEVVVATYQSASGAGQTGLNRLSLELKGEYSATSPFPHPLSENVIPSIGRLMEDQYFLEEWKLIAEIRKIMTLPQLRIFPTAVRVPTPHCHAQAVHLRFESPVNPTDARNMLQQSPGIIIVDNPAFGSYPLPRKSRDRDEVFVGRIRQATGETHTLDLWIVADNLRKGAATNAVQILQQVLNSTRS